LIIAYLWEVVKKLQREKVVRPGRSRKTRTQKVRVDNAFVSVAVCGLSGYNERSMG
jgi:hypothetical protein